MLFNSPEFLLFFTVVLFSFFALPHRFRWIFLVIGSYFFYMCWEPIYALLILSTTVIVFVTGLLMHGKPRGLKKFYVALSLVLNLGILFVFKYFNFFNASMRELMDVAGLPYHVQDLKFLLPVGISFYTFQALSYTIDLYRGAREPEKHFGIFALYVSFFPQLVAGPIERSTRLLPQFYEKKEFNYKRVTDGLKLMAWGFFQKVVIADRLGLYVNEVFGNPAGYEGIPVVMATYFFSIQIYCDFSGYTDIAIGAAQVLGYRLMPNFRRPFFAENIGEFWNRWHMSLIMWFRDYVYIPMGGNRVSRLRHIFNILVVFTLSGLWHGAQWTFVIWGFLNGVFISIGRITLAFRDRARGLIYYAIDRIHYGFFILAGIVSVGKGVYTVARMPGINSIVWNGFLILFGLMLLYFAYEKAMKVRYNRVIAMMKKLWAMFVTFNLFALGAIFFRARSLEDAWYLVAHIPGTNVHEILLNPTGRALPENSIFSIDELLIMFLLVAILFVVHFIQRKGSIREMINDKPLWFRWAFYHILVFSILIGVYKTSQFIYFQF